VDRTIEGAGGDDVFKAIRLEFFEQLFEPGGFKLKYARGIAVRNHPIDANIVEWNNGKIELRMLMFDQLDGNIDHR